MNGTQAFLKNLIDNLNAGQFDKDVGQIFLALFISILLRV
jgi:hypothetical protein